ncbi:hypothetical protein PLICRDRAFT_611905 [Plicaturopsis crispa FD-325 SS-3]|nr:hypothetical protein PLICRDRAFT_611905 [Plicaturopsis crispa FD-325 SS-3]
MKGAQLWLIESSPAAGGHGPSTGRGRHLVFVSLALCAYLAYVVCSSRSRLLLIPLDIAFNQSNPILTQPRELCSRRSTPLHHHSTVLDHSGRAYLCAVFSRRSMPWIMSFGAAVHNGGCMDLVGVASSFSASRTVASRSSCAPTVLPRCTAFGHLDRTGSACMRATLSQRSMI